MIKRIISIISSIAFFTVLTVCTRIHPSITQPQSTYKIKKTSVNRIYGKNSQDQKRYRTNSNRNLYVSIETEATGFQKSKQSYSRNRSSPNLYLKNSRGHSNNSAQERAKETAEVFNNIKKNGETIIEIYRKNLERVRKLEKLIREKEPDDQYAMMDEVRHELTGIATFFEKVATGEMEEEFQRDLRSLEILEMDTQREINSEIEYKRNVQDELISLKEEEPDLARRKIKEESLEKVINFIEKRIEYLKGVAKIQKEISQKASKSVEIPSLFLLAMEENARVFREGLRCIELFADVKTALELFAQVPELEDLTNEIRVTWDSLENLVEMLFKVASTKLEEY